MRREPPVLERTGIGPPEPPEPPHRAEPLVDLLSDLAALGVSLRLREGRVRDAGATSRPDAEPTHDHIWAGVCIPFGQHQGKTLG